MIWLGLLLVVVVALEVLRRERAIGLTMVLASLGFVVSLGLLNVDGFIVRQNIMRELSGSADKALTQGRSDLDAQYFLDLSDDAVPALVVAFTNKSLPDKVREKVGAALVCKQYDRDSGKKFPWQSFHFSRLFADKAFAGIDDQLSAYQIVDTDWPIEVETPGGDKFSCYQYYSD
jgi:hypothetical protein